MKKQLTNEEKKYIEENYQLKSIRTMEKESGISKHYIKNYMADNNLKVDKPPRTPRKNDYTFEQEEFIRANYLTLSYKEIGQYLGKSEKAIRIKISKMGLRKNKEWSQQEILILKETYPIYPNSYVIEKYLPNRDKQSIVRKAEKLGIKKERKLRFTKEQLREILIEYSEELGRTPTILDIHNNKEIPSVATFARYFGSYEQVCLECGLEMKKCIFGDYTTKELAKDSKTICLSNAELYITNFLIDNNIRFEKEKLYSEILNQDCGLKRCDWYLVDFDVIVEYFGLNSKDFYKIKMEEKINICTINNKSLLPITDRYLTKEKLTKIFKEYIYNKHIFSNRND